jgi:iron complex transport system substrate-binding protein
MDVFSIHGSINAPSQRIISLAPSITEMLFYLGMGNSVIGVTRQCNYPLAAGDIDTIGSFSLPDSKHILDLSPDTIIGLSSLHKHLPEIIKDDNMGVILLDYHSVQEILDVMEAVSSLAIDTETALGLIASLRHRVNELQTSNNGARSVKTLFLISESPIIVPSRNSYQYDALRIAGAIQLPNGYTQYERVTLEEVAYFDPEIILACGRHKGEKPPEMCPDCQATHPVCQRVVDDIALKPLWKETGAAINGSINAIPCHWLCRPGPRLIDGIESIAKIFEMHKHAV